MKIFYSTEDTFPPYRVDVGALFSEYLSHKGLDTEWYMRKNQDGYGALESYNKQCFHLPCYNSSNSMFAKVYNKVAFWLFDIYYLTSTLTKSFDLLQVRDKYMAGLFALLIARLKRVPFTYWCSYPFPEHYIELAKLSSGFRRVYCLLNGYIGQFILYKIVIPFSDHTFVQSEKMLKNIAKYGVDSGKMTPVPMGVLDRVVTDYKDEKINNKQIVYIGTLASIRRINIIIEAFALVLQKEPDARLVLVGGGDVPSDKANLIKLVGELGIENAVVFTGFIPIEQAWRIAARSHCGLSPFPPTPVLEVASPTKLVEYMALGRPVICNDHPEQSAILQESAAGLCVSWGVDEFAEAMVWMLQNESEANLMGEKGAVWVKSNRVYSIIAEKVMSKYLEITGKSTK